MRFCSNSYCCNIRCFLPIPSVITINFCRNIDCVHVVSLGIYALRPREGKDLPVPGFKMPLYPVLPALAFIGALIVFLGLDIEAKEYSLYWFIIGVVVYIVYGMHHSNLQKNLK